MDNNYYLKDYLSKKLNKMDFNFPYNYMDALVFSSLTYMPFGKIDTFFYEGYYYEYKIKGLTLEVILEDLLKKDELLKTKFLIKKNKEICEYTKFYEIFEATKNNLRYNKIKVIDYKVILDVHNTARKMPCQFACFLFEIEKEKEYVVAYRGTDSNFEGWIEDLLMIFDDVKAQQESAIFLNKVIEKYKDAKIHITGHSKGGNCAYYSLIKADKKENLDGIFFEAPLFNEKFVDEYKDTMYYLKESGKSFFVNIEHSLISNIYFGHNYSKDEKNTIFVKAHNKTLIKEHNVYSFLVDKNDLLISKESKISKSFNIAFNEIQTLPMEELEVSLTCLIRLLGTSSNTSVFNPKINLIEAFELYVDNFLKLDNDTLLVLSKMFGVYYSAILKFQEANMLDDELLKYYKIFDFLNIFTQAKNAEEIEKFKLKIDKFRHSAFFRAIK
ncbi:MAG: Mbeg1-like protein [Lachnospirales bacterium]